MLAYSGPRPEEVVCRLAWEDVGEQAIRYVDTKRHRTRHTPLLKPLAEDLREWFLASGRPTGKRPVFPAHDGRFWNPDDWRNWRRRTWQGEPERPRRDRKNPTAPRPGCAPKGTRPRDLRSSYVTLRIYEGIPLTQIAREVGTSVRMIEQHYAGVIANWDGKHESPLSDSNRRPLPYHGRLRAPRAFTDARKRPRNACIAPKAECTAKVAQVRSKWNWWTENGRKPVTGRSRISRADVGPTRLIAGGPLGPPGAA